MGIMKQKAWSGVGDGEWGRRGKMGCITNNKTLPKGTWIPDTVEAARNIYIYRYTELKCYCLTTGVKDGYPDTAGFQIKRPVPGIGSWSHMDGVTQSVGATRMLLKH